MEQLVPEHVGALESLGTSKRLDAVACQEL